MLDPKTFIEQFNTSQTLSGLDFGDKTIGIAISDKTHTIATPIMTLKRKSIKKDIIELKKIFTEYNVFGVILVSHSSEDSRQYLQELHFYFGTGIQGKCSFLWYRIYCYRKHH